MHNINNFTNHSAILFETNINYTQINNNIQKESIIIITIIITIRWNL